MMFSPPFSIKAGSFGPPVFQPAERRPFWLLRKMPYPLELLKHCIILSGNFWNVRAFFLLLYLAFVGKKSGESINGILEATAIRGWFKLNRPFLFIRPYKYAVTRAGRSPVSTPVHLQAVRSTSIMPAASGVTPYQYSVSL